MVIRENANLEAVQLGLLFQREEYFALNKGWPMYRPQIAGGD